MTLTPEQVDEILDRTALILADRIEEKVGDLAQYVVFPMAVASHLLSLSTKQIPLYLPVTAIAAGKKGVTLAAIRQHIDKRTEQPKGIAKRKGGAQ
jgi:hypothetical protein